MIPTVFNRCRFGKWGWGGAVLLVLALNVGQAGAADKEERRPDSPAFDSLATLIVYVDEVTPPGAVLHTTSEIWTVFPDGLGKQRLTSGHKDSNPRFSPDGKNIIFDRDRDGEIWMIGTNGGAVRNLTNTPQVSERDAHFSNDGDSLFFLVPGPVPFTDKELAKEPLLALGVSDVLMQLNLKDGTRRQLLGPNYSVKSVFPDPDDERSVLALCTAVEANGKPILWGDKAIVSVPLDGSPPQTVYTAPKRYMIEKARAGGGYLVLNALAPGQFGQQVYLLKRAGANAATEADLKKLEELYFVGDISCEGKLVVGTTITSGIDHWGIVIYDIATGKRSTVMED